MPKVLEKNRAIPLLTLRACVAYKKSENLPTKQLKYKSVVGHPKLSFIKDICGVSQHKFIIVGF